MSDWATLSLSVVGLDRTPSELADVARNLQGELLRLNVDDVRAASGGRAPAGAKAVEAVAVGALVVSLGPALVTAVLDVVVSWLRRQPADIEVELDGQRLKGHVTRQQRDALVAAYLERTTAESRQQ